MAKKPLEIDMCAGSQLRDTQGEMLSVEGADISELLAGNGRLNDNHGKGFHNSVGRVTGARKIFKEEDCEDDRQKYYWNKIKAPYIYVKGVLYDDEDHPNARSAAAILRNIHKSDCPLKIKASVEGGVVSRGVKDSSFLAKTKIHSIALTFTPANNATLVEPINLTKGDYNAEADMILIKSVLHLAQKNVPTFRMVTRDASATKVVNNLNKITELLAKSGANVQSVKLPPKSLILQKSIEHKIKCNIIKITNALRQARDPLDKALMAGYGGASAPVNRVGGNIMQSESLDFSPALKYIVCDDCGKSQVYSKYQVKCRGCNKNFSLEKLYRTLKR